MRALSLTLIFVSLAGAVSAAEPTTPAPEPLPRGQLLEKIAARTDPSETYALYVPTSYKPDRAWPILYAFDARSNGRFVAELFRPGAEKYGFLVASSNTSASDGPMEPNIKSLRAMWADTHERFAIDDKRVYAAGFSGTVRFSCLMAATTPGSIAGIIAAGAGFPFDMKPAADTPFLYYGAVGDRDFNYYEVMDLDEQLTDLGLPHRAELYPGPHQWMPEELATKGLAWMEVQAMKKGTRPKDPALVQALWEVDLARVKTLEASDPVEAHRLLAQMVEDFRGLLDPEVLNGAAIKVSEIAASPAFKRERDARRARDRRDKEYLARAPKALSSPDLEQAVEGLRIYELKKKAESADKAESLSARRLLNTLLGQTGFYLPRMFTEQGNHDRAIFMLSISAEIRPDNPEVWYEIAAAHARKGAKKKALENLRKAVEKGWSDLPRLEQEAAFAPLRQDKGYRELVAEIQKKPAAASGS